MINPFSTSVSASKYIIWDAPITTMSPSTGGGLPPQVHSDDHKSIYSNTTFWAFS